MVIRSSTGIFLTLTPNQFTNRIRLTRLLRTCVVVTMVVRMMRLRPYKLPADWVTRLSLGKGKVGG